MKVYDTITVETKSPTEYRLLQAIVDTYEHFTLFGIDVKWLGFNEETALYTAVFSFEGSAEYSSEFRKADIEDLISYVNEGKYYRP